MAQLEKSCRQMFFVIIYILFFMHFLIFKICFSLFVLEVVYMDTLKEYYLSAGISEDVYCFCDKVQEALRKGLRK